MLFIHFKRERRLRGTRNERRGLYERFGPPPEIAKRLVAIRGKHEKRIMGEFYQKTTEGKKQLKESNAYGKQLKRVFGTTHPAFCRENLEILSRPEVKKLVLEICEANVRFAENELEFARERKDVFKNFLSYLESFVEKEKQRRDEVKRFLDRL